MQSSLQYSSVLFCLCCWIYNFWRQGFLLFVLFLPPPPRWYWPHTETFTEHKMRARHCAEDSRCITSSLLTEILWLGPIRLYRCGNRESESWSDSIKIAQREKNSTRFQPRSVWFWTPCGNYWATQSLKICSVTTMNGWLLVQLNQQPVWHVICHLCFLISNGIRKRTFSSLTLFPQHPGARWLSWG